MSTSWGLYETGVGKSAINAESTIYQKMATQGQSLFAAAGDNGAYDAGGDTKLEVDDPASQPYVTGSFLYVVVQVFKKKMERNSL